MLLRLAVFLLISTGGGALGGWMWSKLSSPSRVYLSMPITIGAALCILLGLYRLQIDATTSAEILISTRAQDKIQENQIQVEGTVSPADSQVYLLVRPQGSNIWWVQPSPVISGDGVLSGTATWIATIYLGSKQEGKSQEFEVIALASANPLPIDFINGNYLWEGDSIKNIPLLSRSNVITLIRE